MHTHDLAEAWRREAIQEGVKQGREGGLQEGREEGVACSLIDVFEARFGTMPKDLRAVVESTHDELTLRGWLKLAITGDANEVAAAIRAFQAR